MFINCTFCGCQNFIGKERLETGVLAPPLCWKCFIPLPLTGETAEEGSESNRCCMDNEKLEDGKWKKSE